MRTIKRSTEIKVTQRQPVIIKLAYEAENILHVGWMLLLKLLTETVGYKRKIILISNGYF